MPENGNARYYMSLRFGGAPPDPGPFCREEAIRRYRALVATHPRDPFALNGLAHSLSEAGDLDEALSYAEKAASLAPENGMILDTFGWILYRKGETVEASELLARSVSFLPDHPIVLDHLGVAHHAAGTDRIARKYLAVARTGSGDCHEKA